MLLPGQLQRVYIHGNLQLLRQEVLLHVECRPRTGHLQCKSYLDFLVGPDANFGLHLHCCWEAYMPPSTCLWPAKDLLCYRKSHVSSSSRPAVLQLRGCMSSTGSSDQRSPQTSAADRPHILCRCRRLLFARNRGQQLPLLARRGSLGAGLPWPSEPQ